MYLIVGLGNPEAEYDKTRHNMGFHVINKIADKYQIELNKNKFNGIFGSGVIEEKKVILLKPQTYMNLSGESVIEFKNYYKLSLDEIIIIYDDIDLYPGEIRIRKKGSPGTHNGMKSIVQCLNSDKFARVRIGIGSPGENENLIEYVIGAVPKEDWKLLDNGTNKAADAVVEILKNGIDKAMNLYN